MKMLKPRSALRSLTWAFKSGRWIGQRREYEAIVKLLKEEIKAVREIGGKSREYLYGMEHMLFLLEGEVNE